MSRVRQEILLVSDRPELRSRVKELLLGEGARVAAFDALTEAVDLVRRSPIGVALVDLRAVSADSLRELKTTLPLSSGILALGAADEEELREALREGAAFAFLEPLDEPLFQQVIRNALERRALLEENLHLRNELRRSKSLIMKDDLTSAYNRRYFDTFLEEEIDRSRRFGSALSLIFMDLDNLKQVNSRFGHAMGSMALREAAVRIIDTVRSIDKVVRYGGDEFCIILPETNWKGAQEVAERIRTRFGERPFLVGKTEGIHLTASFGIAAFPEHSDNRNDLVRKADEAMFRVKATRKNGIMVAQG